MQKFRKKPVVIDAIQFDGTENSVFEILEMKNTTSSARAIRFDGKDLLINTLEGLMRASIGDWIIKGVNGELYPCKPDVFEKTYEPVND